MENILTRLAATSQLLLQKWDACRTTFLSASMLLFVVCTFLVGKTEVSFAQTDQAEHLNSNIIELIDAKKYFDAAQAGEIAVAFSEAIFVQKDPRLLSILQNASVAYGHLKQELLEAKSFANAVAAAKRELQLAERVLPPGDQHRATLMNNLAVLFVNTGYPGDAEQVLKRLLREMTDVFGKFHINTSFALANLADIYRAQNRSSDLIPIYKESIEVARRFEGPMGSKTADILFFLAMAQLDLGKEDEFEVSLREAISITEQSKLPKPGDGTAVIRELGRLYLLRGRASEALPLFERSLALARKLIPTSHTAITNSLRYIGWAHYALGQGETGLRKMEEALLIKKGQPNPDKSSIADMQVELAQYLISLGKVDEADKLLRSALETYNASNDYSVIPKTLLHMGTISIAKMKISDAEAFLFESLRAVKLSFGAEHSRVREVLIEIARMYAVEQNWKESRLYAQQAWSLSRKQRQGIETASTEQTDSRSFQPQGSSRLNAEALVKVSWRSYEKQFPRVESDLSDLFMASQDAVFSSVNSSLSQMAARSAAPEPSIAKIVRARQDFVYQWRRVEIELGAARAANDLGRTNHLRERIEKLSAEIETLDSNIGTNYPSYRELSNTQSASIEELRAQLAPSEALIFPFGSAAWGPITDEIFIWVVTKTDVRWVRTNVGISALTNEISALRCGLDFTAWRGSTCGDLTGQKYPEGDRKAGKPLPFDHRRAHNLYKSLFGEVEDLIKGKHLLLVPTGPLTQLPFHVLVTASTAGDDPKAIRWLARDHAITVLPAVSSLKALRRVGKPSAATEAMIGFGNPLLDGKQDHPDYGDYYKKQAALARANQSCPSKPWQRIATLFGARRDVETVTTRGGLADLAHLRSQAPLPETARELCEVGSSLIVDRKNIWLGARATETNIKRLSAATDASRLANYRIVHFATHGALAGQLTGTTEPGLLLTPPDKATEEDDGYLSAGEIAGLKLDADWVILSACNTAAGNAKGAEALGGLARAFFYAGARALLVSHWEVDSEATVKLITSAVGAMAKDQTVGRAEALRRAMLNMIDNGQPHEAHPAYWAPFVVVGEGAAGK